MLIALEKQYSMSMMKEAGLQMMDDFGLNDQQKAL